MTERRTGTYFVTQWRVAPAKVCPPLPEGFAIRYTKGTAQEAMRTMVDALVKTGHTVQARRDAGVVLSQPDDYVSKYPRRIAIVITDHCPFSEKRREADEAAGQEATP